MKKFVNESRWEDADVIALIEAGAAAHGVSLKNISVTVETFRGKSRSSASANPKGTGFTLKLMRPERLPAPDAVTALANVGHERPEKTAFGADLADVCHSITWAIRYVGGLGKHTPYKAVLPEWAVGMVLRPKPPEPKQAKPRLTDAEIDARRAKRRAEKLADSRAKLAKWERKLKLAKTKVSFYKREVKRREKPPAKKSKHRGFPGAK